MTDWSGVFLGVIAAATLTMATIQVGALVIAARLARRVEQLVTRVEQEVQPLIGRVTALSGDAARATALAVTQMERVDRLSADFTRRAEETLAEVQRAIILPARETYAVVSAIRSGIGALRGLGRPRRPPQGGAHGEDDDPLFIG